MTPKIILRPEAEAEVAEAFIWYEQQSLGLGTHFLMCMEAALSQICRHPEAFPVVHLQIRRALLRRFPYGVFYLMDDQRIVVIAVFHAKRSPKHWKKRK